MKPSFPTRLTPFEEYFLFKHTADNPSTFCVELDLAGTLTPELAAAAARHVCQFHPILRCRVDLNRGRPRWVLTDMSPTIEWVNQPPSVSNLASSNIDITVQSPLKIYAYNGIQGAAKLVFLLHHSAVDGLGTLQWLNDFLHVYRRLQRGESLSDLKRDLQLLKKRCRPGLGWQQALRLMPGQWLSVRETFRILSRKIIPLVPWSLPSQGVVRSPSCIDFELSPSDTIKLKQEAARQGTSLNSWALRSLLISIQRWQQNVGSDSSSRETQGTHYRIVVPINERQRIHKWMPACNHCTMINLDLTREEVTMGSTLLQEVDRTLSLIQRWRLSLNVWRAMEVFRWMPGGLKKFAQNESVAATALLTNVGRILQNFAVPPNDATADSSDNGTEGGTEQHQLPLSVSNVKAYPPLQRGMVLAIVLYYFNHELRISAQYDERFLTATDAKHLMEAFRNELYNCFSG